MKSKEIYLLRIIVVYLLLIIGTSVYAAEKGLIIKKGIGDKVYKETVKSDPYVNRNNVLEGFVWTLVDKEYPEFKKQNVGDILEMKKWVEGKLESDSNNSVLLLYYGVILNRVGDFQKCLDVLDKITEVESPLENLLYLNKSKCFDHMGRIDLAKECYNKISIIEDDPELWRYKGVLITKGGDKDRAIKEWEALLEKYPWYSPAMFDIAIDLCESKRYKDALRYLDVAISNIDKVQSFKYGMEPGLVPKINFYQGLAEIMEGNLKKTVECITEGLKYSYNDPQMQAVLGFILNKIDEIKYKKDDYYLMENFYAILAEKYPDNARILYRLAFLKLEQEKYEDALPILKCIIDKKLITPEYPDYPKICYNIGWLMAKQISKKPIVEESEFRETVHYLRECIEYTKEKNEIDLVEKFIEEIKKHYPQFSETAERASNVNMIYVDDPNSDEYHKYIKNIYDKDIEYYKNGKNKK